jgi:hypothetical protein
LINIALSQLGWFAIVLSAARGKPWIGITCAALLIVVHLMRSSSRNREGLLILICAVVGLLVDTALIASGAIAFSASAVHALPPVWMTALWMLFGTMLCHSLSWLQQRPLLAAAMGFVSGPLAYVAGARLGALSVREGMRALATIGVLWSVALTALTRLARELTASRVGLAAMVGKP